MNPNSARSNPKSQAQRNITPNFLRFKRMIIFIQASPNLANKKIKVYRVMALKEAILNLIAELHLK